MTYWDCQPKGPVGASNSIPVTPASAVILNIIVEDEDIGFFDLVKIASPWDVRGLEDYAFHEPGVIPVLLCRFLKNKPGDDPGRLEVVDNNIESNILSNSANQR